MRDDQYVTNGRDAVADQPDFYRQVWQLVLVNPHTQLVQLQCLSKAPKNYQPEIFSLSASHA